MSILSSISSFLQGLGRKSDLADSAVAQKQPEKFTAASQIKIQTPNPPIQPQQPKMQQYAEGLRGTPQVPTIQDMGQQVPAPTQVSTLNLKQRLEEMNKASELKLAMSQQRAQLADYRNLASIPTTKEASPQSKLTPGGNPAENQIKQDVTNLYPLTPGTEKFVKDQNIDLAREPQEFAGRQRPEVNLFTQFLDSFSTKIYDKLPSWAQQAVNSVKLGAEHTLNVKDPVVAAHEIIHSVWDSKLPTAQTAEEQSQKITEYIDGFNSNWEQAKEANPILNDIDEHLQTQELYGNITERPDDLAKERYSYLAESIGQEGIDAIPKELNSFYKDVFRQRIPTGPYLQSDSIPTKEEVGTVKEPQKQVALLKPVLTNEEYINLISRQAKQFGYNPKVIATKVIDTAKKYGFTPNQLLNILDTESTFNPTAVSGANAVGIAQFTPITVKQVKEQYNPNFNPLDPLQAIDAMGWYARQIAGQIESSDIEEIYKAYNYGVSGYKKAFKSK